MSRLPLAVRALLLVGKIHHKARALSLKTTLAGGDIPSDEITLRTSAALDAAAVASDIDKVRPRSGHGGARYYITPTRN